LFYTSLESVAVGCVLLQWSMLAFHVKKINAFHAYISKKKNILEKYAQLLSLAQDQPFSTPLLQALRARTTDAYKHVNKLASLMPE
jgi:hypothetical protein